MRAVSGGGTAAHQQELCKCKECHAGSGDLQLGGALRPFAIWQPLLLGYGGRWATSMYWRRGQVGTGVLADPPLRRSLAKEGSE